MSQTPEQTIAELQQKIKDLEFQLKKAKDSLGYGLKWEEKPEIFEERAQNALPLLKEDKNLLIDNKSDLDHIIIEGDNYHALSALNYTHKGMIDVIYIDPPYNTGTPEGGFIYNDDYVDKNDSYKHSKWISFMYKRLKLAKTLLSNDGVIFISIDDHEQAPLKLLCDDIFLEDNLTAIFPRLTTKSGKTPISYMISHDYVFCYTRNIKNVFVGENFEDNSYKYSDEFESERGKYNLKQPLDCNSISYSPSLDYPIEHEGKVYYPGSDYENYKKRKAGNYLNKDYARRWSKNLYEFGLKNGWIVFKNGRIYTKGYLNAGIEDDGKGGYEIIYRDKERKISSLDFIDNNYSNDIAKKQLRSFNLPIKFDYPKPITLIEKLLSTYYKKNAIILDFFAGSGTAGHAVLDLNKQDGGRRQFILCSNRENTKENPDKNICKDITYERIKKVIQGYVNDKGKKVEGLGGGNLRYYTTDFIQKDKSIDDLRFAFMDRCDELLCIKENTFETVRVEENNYLKAYKKGDKITVILYDGYYFDDLIEFLKSCNEKEISLYIFDLSKEMYEEDIVELGKNISVQNIPNDILETYKRIFIL